MRIGPAAQLLLLLLALPATLVGAPARADDAPPPAAAGTAAADPATATAAAAADPTAPACELPATVDRSLALDPACAYAGSTTIVASGVTLDCKGALIDARAVDVGIAVAGRSIVNVTIADCRVDGARLNNIFIEPPLAARDLAALPEDERYALSPKAVSVVGGTVTNAGNVGIFVGAYAQDTTIRDVTVSKSGSTGIYLEHSSVRATISDSRITGNGYGDPLGRDDRERNREGIAVDSSAHNRIVSNTLTGNSAGGVFLYKNCFEHHESPNQVPRTMPSAYNVIEGNSFDGPVGVWIASRQSKNLSKSDCGDPPLAPGYYRDRADHTTVTGNVFAGGTFGVVIEDDFATVTDNVFTAITGSCVQLGTKIRDKLIGPIEGTVLTGNQCTDVGRNSPYRTLGASVFATCENNLSSGGPAACTPGP